jgi:methylenetetrahydrofolate dehydrogenase (NADP+)/methenyltetrahydrofolate cyclohydrolase
MILDGKKIAREIRLGLRERVARLGFQPGFCDLLVGNDPASIQYVDMKGKAAQSVGMAFRRAGLPAGVTTEEVVARIGELNREPDLCGLIVQLPLPKKFNNLKVTPRQARGVNKVTDLLDSKKDIDNLTGLAEVPAPTVGVLQKIFKEIKFNPRGKQAAVVGRGQLVGQPIALWLKSTGAKVTILGKGELKKGAISKADLIVTGVGKAKLITGDMIKKGAVLVDYGYALKDGKLFGDLDFESCSKKAKWITATPGGTGPMVVVQLFENFYKLNFINQLIN